MEKPEKKVTPMMRQFLDLKNTYSDCILLFRAGDFYETFYEDAKIASKVLGITLTKRGDTPMAGVPYHSINPYVKKLIQNNYKVAFCEQLEDPKLAKGLVKRGVTKVITAGTILEDDFLEKDENNFIMCIFSPKNIAQKYGISLVDITTGEFLTTQVDNLDDVKTIIKKYCPNEIILNESSFVRKLKEFIKNLGVYYNFLSDIRFNINYSNEILKKQFGLNLNELGFESKDFCAISAGALLFYIYKLQRLDLSHINKISYLNMNNNMILDSVSLRNLELTRSIFSSDNSKTLFSILNNTKTSSGMRLLKKSLLNPLINPAQINLIYDCVEELNEFIIERDEIRNLLDGFFDIERIVSRIASGIASPKDLYALKLSLLKLPKLKLSLQIFKSKKLVEIKKINLLTDITDLLERSISETAPSHFRDIGYIKKDFNLELKDLFDIAYNSKDFISTLEEEYRLSSSISTLKIKYNKIFGYFIDIPKSQTSKIPVNYNLIQSLTNSYRYSTTELKEKEHLILGAEEKIKILEKKLFEEILLKLKLYIKNFQQISKKIALLDVIINHSYNSSIYNYVRPVFTNDITQIEGGRNPIVERFTSQFISNDTYFDSKESLKIITGPNMAGKSTYLRQNALIVIMAQMGSFIPAKSAKLKIYDRVFTRIGAHDELAEGQSTFMVEMVESANILNNASKKSLVVLDEIGRGTSTYDGLAIAWAITEDLSRIGCDTIFATHYHQLNKLKDFYFNIENYNVLVSKEGDKIIFIRKIVKGGTNKSYGIYVGKLAGIPQKVLDRAQTIQKNIEDKEEIVINDDFKKSFRKTKISNKDNNEKGLNGFI